MSHPQPGGSALSAAEEVQRLAASPHLSSPSSGGKSGPRAVVLGPWHLRRLQESSLASVPVQPQSALHLDLCGWLLTGESVGCYWDGSSLNVPLFPWAEGGGFLSNHQICLLDLPRAVRELPSIQSLSWIFQGFVPLFHLSPGFSWARLLPVIVIFAPAAQALTSPVTSWLLLHMRPAQQRTFPFTIYPFPPVVQVSGLVSPCGYWNTGRLCLLGD